MNASRSASIGARFPAKPINRLRCASPSNRFRRNQVINQTVRAALATPATTIAVEKTALALATLLASSVSVSALLAKTDYMSLYKVGASGFISAPVLLQHSIAATLIGVVAVAAYRTYQAAINSRMSSDTYQRLTLTTAAAMVTPMLSFLAYCPDYAALPTVARVLLSSRFAVGAVLIGIWAKTSSRPASLLQDIANGVGDIVSPPSSLLSAFYSAWTAVAAAGGVHLLRQAPAGVWGETVISKTLGVHGLVAAGVLYTLKNAADRNRLGGNTFKQLNLATGSAFSIIAGLVYSASNAGTVAAGNTTTGVIAALVVSAVVTLYKGLTAVSSEDTSVGGSSVASTGKGYEYRQSVDPLEKFCESSPDADECKVFED